MMGFKKIVRGSIYYIHVLVAYYDQIKDLGATWISSFVSLFFNSSFFAFLCSDHFLDHFLAIN